LVKPVVDSSEQGFTTRTT